MRLQSKRVHEPLAFGGRVDMLLHESQALRGNPLGDPHRRELALYVPPGTQDLARLPVLYLLAGFTGRGQSFLGSAPWFPGIVQRYDQALQRGELAPALVAMPDCFTRYGGAQYLNTSAQGNYRDYLMEELLPLVDAEYGTGAATDRARGVLGKSSGGFGALRLGMSEAGAFQAVGSISGDCGFENTFGSEFLQCLRGLLDHDMDPGKFLAAFERQPSLEGDGHAVINVLAMAACYSPNPEAALGFDLPFDLHTGLRKQEVWERWLQFDPIQAIEQEAHRSNLRALRLLHIECGLRDEFHLQWGTRHLAQRLRELQIPHTHEEHPGGHRGIDERYLKLLPRLIEALA